MILQYIIYRLSIYSARSAHIINLARWCKNKIHKFYNKLLYAHLTWGLSHSVPHSFQEFKSIAQWKAAARLARNNAKTPDPRKERLHD